MHQMFRQYAQQMGMQNVRAILPEQIDLLINNSISDTVNQIITQNIGVTNDRVITDNSKINQVNALKSLYKIWNGVVELKYSKTSYINSYNLNFKDFHFITKIENKRDDDNDFKSLNKASYFSYVNGTKVDSGKDLLLNVSINDGFYKENVADKETIIQREDYDEVTTKFTIENSIDFLYLVDLSLNYVSNTNFITNIFPVRIIDDSYLADVVNDFVLAPRFRSPVATIHDDSIELYIDTDEHMNSAGGIKPAMLRLSYISKPVKVHFGADTGVKNVNCDLPDYLHVDIVKHAVELYQIALSGSLAATNQAQQNQQRENVRNNYRDDGNQQRQQ